MGKLDKTKVALRKYLRENKEEVKRELKQLREQSNSLDYYEYLDYLGNTLDIESSSYSKQEPIEAAESGNIIPDLWSSNIEVDSKNFNGWFHRVFMDNINFPISTPQNSFLVSNEFSCLSYPFENLMSIIDDPPIKEIKSKNLDSGIYSESFFLN